MKRRVRDLRRLFENAGATSINIAVRKHIHVQATAPNGAHLRIVTSSTPSDHRADRNILALLRRAAAE